MVTAISAAIQNSTLQVGVPVLSTTVESSCPAGTFVSDTMSGGARICGICNTGYFSDVNNAPQCTACRPGYAAGVGAGRYARRRPLCLFLVPSL